jgi:hypothetical protein
MKRLQSALPRKQEHNKSFWHPMTYSSTEDQKDMLDDEFTITEVQDALNDANDVSAPGPSGQNNAFYKLLFTDIPNIMT